MQKTLRSLIHEKIPPELRFQLELLSRKRNLVNAEKHEKIIELFREFDIKDIVLLGPGTNRYAIKIDGYVLKIATDHDGKVDNLKEFKMAKRLFPYVTKTYEVSENGTLLVAEYISPFSSYHEMTTHAEKIREILTKLSSTYLIGDVGITSKNFANWGLRAGSDDPVCLDFAYVYEVSSDLFVCRECKTNSMLVPDRDFKRLNCSNPSCGKEYSFEDIRAKIGNDIHRHEIGDLKEEGYYLTSSNIVTELTEQRSNYLVSKKSKDNNGHLKSLEIETEEDTTMTHLENTMAIAESMANQERFVLPVIRATARVANHDSNKDNLIHAIARPAKVKEVQHEPEEDLAFSGSMEEDMQIVHQPETPDVTPDIVQIPKNGPEEIPVIKATAKVVEKAPETPKPAAPVENDDTMVIPAKAKHVNKPEKKPTDEINEWYIKNMKRAFSKISNRISNCLHMACQFDEVRNDIKDKMYAEDYYKNVQNAVFRSMVAFCNFEVTSEPNEKGKGSHKIFTPPTEIIGTSYEDTMVFMARVWNNRSINTVEDPGMMDAYRAAYTDYLGIQRDWIEMFKERLAKKMNISQNGINKVANAIASVWCVPEEVIESSPETPDEPKDREEEAADEVKETVDAVVPVMKFDTPNANGRIYPAPDNNDSEEIAEMSPSEAAEAIVMGDDSEDVVFSGSTGIDVVQSPTDEDDDDEYEDDVPTEGPEYLSVEIYHEDDCDIIRINTEEFFGPVSIPFYTSLDSINGNDYTPSIADDRNGVWDWLIHMVPDLMFTTKDPTKWLNFNDVEPEVNQPHVVIMDEDRGEYTMGVYFLKGIFDIDDDGNMTPVFDEELLKKINKLIRDDIGYGRISHLRRSLNTDDLIYDEDAVMEMLDDVNYDGDDDGDEDESSDAENAAITVLMAAQDIPDPKPVEKIQTATVYGVVGDTPIDGEEAAPEEVAAEETFQFGGDVANNAAREEKVQETTGEAEGKGKEATPAGNVVTTFKPIRRNRN